MTMVQLMTRMLTIAAHRISLRENNVSRLTNKSAEYLYRLEFKLNLTLNLMLIIVSGLERKEESLTDVDFSYKDVSQLSEVTDDVYAESVADEDADLRDYNRLIQQTQKKLHIVGKQQ